MQHVNAIPESAQAGRPDTTGNEPRYPAPPPLAQGLLGNLRFDAPAGLVVFLVALPLCLGIALASGAPLLSGIIAGVIGGLVVPLISKASLSVSGPAAGLAAIVLAGLTKVGSLEVFALAVVIAGALQIVLGLLRAGGIANYMPSSVIHGMLAAIGVLLILKQVPHALGFDKDNFASQSFKAGDENTFSLIPHAFASIEWGAVIVSVLALATLILWEKSPTLKRLSFLPGALVAVLLGTVASMLIEAAVPALTLESKHLVALPEGGVEGLVKALHQPDWSAITRLDVWVLGLTLAIVASLETLLNLEAVDQIDPWARKSPPSRELVAQGVANLTSGLLGGLPITSVIVRSSANVNAGGRTRVAAFLHGAFLLLAVLFAASLLARIPLAALASVLLMTGYKLAKPKLFVEMYHRGVSHIVPFVVTILGVVFTDLLKGVLIGLAVGIFFVLRASMSRVFNVANEDGRVTIKLNKDAHFFVRARLAALFEHLPSDTRVVIVDARVPLDHDVAEVIRTFQRSAQRRNIEVQVYGVET